MSHGRLAQALFVIGRWFAKATSDDQAISIARQTVTNRTEDPESLLAAVEYFLRDWKGKLIGVIRIGGRHLGRTRGGHRCRSCRTGRCICRRRPRALLSCE